MFRKSIGKENEKSGRVRIIIDQQRRTQSVGGIVITDEELRRTYPAHKAPSMTRLGSYTNIDDTESPEDSTLALKRTVSRKLDRPRTKGGPGGMSSSAPASQAAIGVLTSAISAELKTTASNMSLHQSSIKGRKNKSTYEGITHSDLDVQHLRAPLLHQLNAIEWLWLHSTGAHRGILMILFFLGTVVLCNLFNSSFWGNTRVENPYVCDDVRCIDLATRLKKKLNTSVKPCDDFYAFVCGTSGVAHDLSQEEDENWSFGFYSNRLSYDFRAQESLGNMFKRVEAFPENLILPFYKGCLNTVSRGKLGLQPFYALLKTLKLYNVSKTSSLTGADASYAIAVTLSHFLRMSTIIKHNVIKDPATGQLSMYISPAIDDTMKFGTVSFHGYELYKETVKEVFRRLTELRVDAGDLETIAQDIVCLELYFSDRVKLSSTDTLANVLVNEPSVQGMSCDLGDGYTGTPAANFGKPVNGDFDYIRFVRQLYEISNPDWDKTKAVPIYGNPRDSEHSDKEYLQMFEQVFNQSAPIRIMRFLQWRILYALAFDLTQDVAKLMVKVQRFKTSGNLAICIQDLFIWLHFLASDRFINVASHDEIKHKEREFNLLTEVVSLTKKKILSRNKFKEFSSTTVGQMSDSDKELLKKMIAVSMRVDQVPPIAFTRHNFPRYRELYEGITFDEDKHFENIMKIGFRMNSWNFNPKFQDAFFSIKEAFHVPIGIDLGWIRYHTANGRYLVYIPLAGAEPPFFQDGLEISDFGGVGLIYAGNVENAYMFSIVENVEETLSYAAAHFLAAQAPRSKLRQMIQVLKAQHNDLSKKYENLYNNGKWKTGDLVWNKFLNRLVRARNFDTLIKDQKRYHVLSLLLDEFLSTHRRSTMRKVLLPGLEQYNVKQIYYISLVNRRCAKNGKKMLEHILKYGPITHALRNNIVLSNLDHFSTTFNCPAGSPMNPPDKIYFWDRDLNISNMKPSEIKFSLDW